MALKQVFVLLAALCAVLGRPTEMEDPLLKSSVTPEMSKCDTESDQVGAGAVNYYPLARPMAFIPVYYLPSHGIAPKLKLRRPMQKEGDAIPTMVYSNPKMSQNVKPEKESPFRAGQKNLEGLSAIPSSMIAQPAQSTKNLDKSLGSLGNVEEDKSRKDALFINRESGNPVLPSELDKPISSVDSQQAIPAQSSTDIQSADSPLLQGKSTGLLGNLDQGKIQDPALLMNPQLRPIDSQGRISPRMDLPMSKNVDQPGVLDQEGLASLAEPSPLAIPRLKRSPQFGLPAPYGYDGYPYGGYGGYGGYPGYGPYDYPFYGDEIIDVDIRVI